MRNWGYDLSVTACGCASSPERGGKAAACERNPLASPYCLPLRGRWHREAVTEGVGGAERSEAERS